MKLSPLQIAACYFSQVAIRANAAAKGSDLKRVDFNVDVQTYPDAENPRKWFVFLELKITPEEGVVAPYCGEISMMGSFDVAENWPENQIEKLVYINGAGLLYAAAREMISTITAKGWFDSLLAPSWSFLDMYKDFDAQRKLSAQPELKIEPAATGENPGPSEKHSPSP